MAGMVELFPGPSGWHFVAAPPEVSAACAEVAAGEYRWHTSLMPKGDGSQFVPLDARAQKALRAEAGDTVVLRLQVRPPG